MVITSVDMPTMDGDNTGPQPSVESHRKLRTLKGGVFPSGEAPKNIHTSNMK